MIYFFVFITGTFLMRTRIYAYHYDHYSIISRFIGVDNNEYLSTFNGDMNTIWKLPLKYNDFNLIW